MIGVVSAPSPEKATVKIFNQKLRGKNEITKESPIEICMRDLGAGSDSHFRLWIEVSESIENTEIGKEGKKAVKRLIVRKVT